jgi:ATP-dependent RNA helicase DDX51/DBP6
VKKSKRQKVLRAARKAAAPKNKQWMPDGEEGAGLAGNAAGLHAEESESSSDDEVEEEEAVIALSTAVLPAPHSSTVAKDPEDERAMRKQEKREKRAQRTERRAARAAKRAAMTAAGASPAPIHDINEDDLKDDPEGLDNIDEGDPVDPSSPAFDFLPLLEPSAHISRSPSPPYLEPFPLPMPVAAPNPEILSRQGLPAGLEDAEFVDQELKVSVDQIGAKSAKGVSERMRKRLKEIGVEDFFAGTLYHRV